MMITLPFFKDLNSESLTDYYEVDVDIEKEKIQLDINFKEASINPDKLVTLKNYLGNLPLIINIAKKEIDNDFENGEEVMDFLNFHVEELDQNDLDLLLKHADKTLAIEEQILSRIRLRRIGFYPYNSDQFAIFDFVLDEEISQYILVVVLNENKTLDHITMES